MYTALAYPYVYHENKHPRETERKCIQKFTYCQWDSSPSSVWGITCLLIWPATFEVGTVTLVSSCRSWSSDKYLSQVTPQDCWWEAKLGSICMAALAPGQLCISYVSVDSARAEKPSQHPQNACFLLFSETRCTPQHLTFLELPSLAHYHQMPTLQSLAFKIPSHPLLVALYLSAHPITSYHPFLTPASCLHYSAEFL
jgi:hypothetical protein